MSLLSEDVSQVAESQELLSKKLAIVFPQVTQHLPLISGVFRQAVGYCSPRDQEYTYVIDPLTGQPLKLPEGSIPISVYTTPMQFLPNDSYFYMYFVDTPTINNNTNTYYIDSWDGYIYNNRTREETAGGKVSGSDFQGYNWITMYNDYFPDPNPTGVIKFVIEYI